MVEWNRLFKKHRKQAMSNEIIISLLFRVDIAVSVIAGQHLSERNKRAFKLSRHSAL